MRDATFNLKEPPLIQKIESTDLDYQPIRDPYPSIMIFYITIKQPEENHTQVIVITHVDGALTIISETATWMFTQKNQAEVSEFSQCLYEKGSHQVVIACFLINLVRTAAELPIARMTVGINDGKTAIMAQVKMDMDEDIFGMRIQPTSLDPALILHEMAALYTQKREIQRADAELAVKQTTLEQQRKEHKERLDTFNGTYGIYLFSPATPVSK